MFVEYSAMNFRLTRCPQCGKIADKYIEYELLLVLIDILLHEDAAFYHLLYNRYNSVITKVRNFSSFPCRCCPLANFYFSMQRAGKWLPFAVIFISILVKFIVFRTHRYAEYTLQNILHATLASICDISIYTITLGSLLGYLSYRTPENPSIKSTLLSTITSNNNSSSFEIFKTLFQRYYLTLLFPEIFKSAIIILYIFDSTANLLFLLNFIIVSLQVKGMECILKADKKYLLLQDQEIIASNGSTLLSTSASSSSSSSLLPASTSPPLSPSSPHPSSSSFQQQSVHHRHGHQQPPQQQPVASTSMTISSFFQLKEIRKKKAIFFHFLVAIICRIIINFAFYSLKEILILGGLVMK